MQVIFWDDKFVSTTGTVWNDTANLGNYFNFTLKKATDGFLGIDYYNTRMYPKGCRPELTISDVTVIKDGVVVSSFRPYEYQHYGFIRDTWKAGKYSVFVKTNWGPNVLKDYSFRTFMPSGAVTAIA